MIEEGTKFPDFSLSDQDGNLVTREQLLGSRSIVYFYPKDDTTGCTAEACSFRDRLPDFGSVPVIGISPDSAKSHHKFVEKYSLNFPLLADVDHQLAQSLGIWVKKSMYGKDYMGIERTTYLLDSDATIMKIWRKVKVTDHIAEVLASLEGK